MNRGDVVLLDWSYSDLMGSKLRPAVVVQADFLDGILDDTVAGYLLIDQLFAQAPGAAVPLRRRCRPARIPTARRETRHSSTRLPSRGDR
jgi:hypothetical protein